MRYRPRPDGEIGHNENDRQSKSLYISHFISAWNSRGFEFGAVLFLATIYPGTLLPLSVYALIRALAAVLFSPAIGKFIDYQSRLHVIRLSILGQRLAIMASCGVFLCLLLLQDYLPDVLSVGLFFGVVFLACVEKLCSIMNTVSIERDWVVVIANGDKGFLQEMNAQMRRIDLFCKLISPLAIALLDGFSSSIAVTVTLGINSTSVIAEYFLIAWVYTKTPALAIERSPRSSGSEQVMSKSCWSSVTGLVSPLWTQLTAYARSHAFLPSLSLSMLYFTVLSFSGQMITYLFSIQSPQLNSIHIGILRTLATTLEISSTFIAPRMIDRLGAVRAGIWSLCWQFLCLTAGVATFWIPMLGTGSKAKTYLFVTSVILSRIGLWSFDLIAQLLVQNSVHSTQRGSFSATEASLQNLFELGTFAMTIIWPKPAQFKYPATITLVAVYLATALYARFVRVQRGHLLHIPSCCKSAHKYEAVQGDEPVSDVEMYGFERIQKVSSLQFEG